MLYFQANYNRIEIPHCYGISALEAALFKAKCTNYLREYRLDILTIALLKSWLRLIFGKK